MRKYMVTICACTVLAASPASAHGPQIQVTNTGNKITTRELIPVGPYGTALTPQKQVYVMPVAKVISGSPSTDYWTVLPNSSIDTTLGVSAYQFGPGLAYGYGHTFASGEHFNVNFTDPLEFWDGSSFVASYPGFDEEIGAFRGDNTTSADQAATTDSAPFQSLVFSNISATYNDESHSSMRFRMRGNGISALVEPNDGIYLFRFQVTSTQVGLAASDIVSLVLHKNATSSQLMSAVSSLGVDPSLVQFVDVPEPSAFVLGIAAACGLASIRTTGRRRN